MKKSISYLMSFAIMTLFNSPQSHASNKAPDPLDDFSYLSQHAFSVSVNMGVYLDEPMTLKVSLENSPDAAHNGNLRSLSSSFSGSEEFLATLFGDFIFQVTMGKGQGLAAALLTAKAKVGEEVEVGDSGKPALDMGEMMAFALKTGYGFERFYSSGGERGIVRLSLQADLEVDGPPNENWISFPHPILEAGSVGLQVLRTLLAKAHDVSGKETRGSLYS